MRLFGVLAVVALMLSAFPFAATAAAPDYARISATSYLDLGGNGSPSLCDEFNEFAATVSYSGVGSNLGGNGSGEMFIETGKGFYFEGMLEVDGETMYVEGEADLVCLTSGYAFVYGYFEAYGERAFPTLNSQVGALALEPGEAVCGGVAGYIQDGVHRNQGRVSLTLTAESETECFPD